MTACIRSRNPNLVSTFETWVLMVPSPKKSFAASSELLFPVANRRRISVSRSVSRRSSASLLRCAGRAMNPSMTFRVIDGARRASPAATTLTAWTSSSDGEFLSRNPLAPAA